jgi:hypothetical protein
MLRRCNMNMNRKLGKYVFSVSAAMIVAMGMMHSVSASEPIYYEGTAALCAVSTNMFDPLKEKGNNANSLSYMDNLVMVWQIKSPGTPLMNGSEVMHTQWTETSSGVVFQTGELVMTPDIYAGTGAFEEKFKFKVNDSAITGVYKGSGDLKGVTATYTLAPAPYVCDLSFDWASLCPECVPLPFPNGYDMEGWIEGYDPE